MRFFGNEGIEAPYKSFKGLYRVLIPRLPYNKNQPVLDEVGMLISGVGVDGPIGSEDLDGVAKPVRDQKVCAVTISDAKPPKLEEAISKRDACRRTGRVDGPAVPGRCRAWMQRPVLPEDLCRLSTLVRDTEVVVVHCCQAPLAELDEALSKGDAMGKAQGSVPGTVVRSGPGEDEAVGAVDHRRLAVLVGEGEVRCVDGCQAPLAQLEEAVPEGPEVPAASSVGHLRDGLASPRCWLPVVHEIGPLAPGLWVQGSVVSEDLDAVARVAMGDQKKVTVAISDPEVAELQEPETAPESANGKLGFVLLRFSLERSSLFEFSLANRLSHDDSH